MSNQKIRIEVPHKFSGLLDDYRYYVYYGGRGSAKSWAVAQYLLCKSLQSQIKILCTREFQNSILESVYSLFKGLIVRYGMEQYFSTKTATIECINGSAFIFKGLAHNIESVKSTEGIDICWVEEADKVSQNSWDILIPTIRKKDSKIIATFNPTFDDDPAYSMFVLNQPPEAIVQKVNYNDNPHFPDVLRKEMEHMRATDYEKYLHVWEGDLRTISDAQIFKGKYVVQDFSSEGVEAFKVGMDFGFAKDPSTVIRCFIRDANLYIDREAYGHGIEIPDLAHLINAVVPNRFYKIYADCARPETISFIKGLGYNILGAPKWSGSILDGIEFIRSFQKVVIHPSCKHTIEEFKRYSFKIDKRTNEVLPIPIDDFNHLQDSLRYSLSDLIKHKISIYDKGFL
jgi:phage terminase large subunit